MRTIQDIKREITDAFIRNDTIFKAYGLKAGQSFDQQFSQASLESILFYVVASAIWLLESLFEQHKKDVEESILSLEPHTLRWYTRKAKDYLHGIDLVPNKDYYPNLSDEARDEVSCIRYAVATEGKNVVYIKVAGADEGLRPRPLTEEEYKGLVRYMNDIKDAGVLLEIINKEADQIKINLDIYLSDTITQSSQKQKIKEDIEEGVKRILYELPFDGRYRSSDLVLAIQNIQNVEVAYVRQVQTKPHLSQTWKDVEGFHRPSAGYYKLEDLSINFKTYQHYDL